MSHYCCTIKRWSSKEAIFTVLHVLCHSLKAVLDMTISPWRCAAYGTGQVSLSGIRTSTITEENTTGATGDGHPSQPCRATERWHFSVSRGCLIAIDSGHLYFWFSLSSLWVLTNVGCGLESFSNFFHMESLYLWMALRRGKMLIYLTNVHRFPLCSEQLWIRFEISPLFLKFCLMF